MNLSNQQQTRLTRLNETIMTNNEEHRSKNRQTHEQLKNLTQTYEDLNDKYVNKVRNFLCLFLFLFLLFQGNVSEILCGSRGLQNNQCSICGGEGCSSTCANSSSQCSSSIYGQLNELMNIINSTQNELSIKQDETNLIYARQYEIEQDITKILNEILRQQQTFSSFNITLNETSFSIDLIQQQITNLTDILHDRKPADIREIIERILTKKIYLTSTNLEESIRDIRALVEQAQKSSQTGNELEKIRDATFKLNRAKNIENDLSTYVRLDFEPFLLLFNYLFCLNRSYSDQENGIKLLDNLVDTLDNETNELKRLARETNQRIEELKTAVIQVNSNLLFCVE
jgi:uncharacterized coiled-coil protein SlyX